MSRANPLADKATITSFGKNVYMCCELIGSTIDSFGLRTDIRPAVLADYREGRRDLSREHIEAAACEFQLKPVEMVGQYGDDEHRRIRLESLLSQRGALTASRLLGTKPPAIPVAKKPAEVEVVVAENNIVEATEPPLPKEKAAIVAEPITTTPIEEEVMSDEDTTIVSAEKVVTWDENDLVATTADGVTFNLLTKEMRARVIAHIRLAIKGTDWNFVSLDTAAKLKKPSSWWRGVEIGQARISGTNIESIAEVLGLSVYSLLMGPATEPAAPAPAEQTPVVAEVPPVVAAEAEMAAPVSPAPTLIVAEPPTPEVVLVATPAAVTEEQEYFRLLVLSADTEPAPGVSIGQLLELARDQEQTAWVRAYLTMTVAGQKLAYSIAATRELVASHGKPIQAMYLEAITEVYEV
ncbi:MAG: hypothetical protein JWL75_475 [Parcubacteria group bacterium]|nr:hypothetical protein [Parcubacteria group bacterium]